MSGLPGYDNWLIGSEEAGHAAAGSYSDAEWEAAIPGLLDTLTEEVENTQEMFFWLRAILEAMVEQIERGSDSKTRSWHELCDKGNEANAKFVAVVEKIWEKLRNKWAMRPDWDQNVTGCGHEPGDD